MPTTILKSSLITLAAAASILCSSEPLAVPPAKEAGTYELNFLWNGELILWAHIESAAGDAPDGVVVFQYCSYRGLPPNDITQPDEAPSSACADGSGRWRNLNARVAVDTNGDAFLNFGVIQVVNTIGFRYSYSRGSVVANGGADPEDWIRP